MMSDRDYIIRIKIHKLDGGKVFMTTTSEETRPDCPPVKGVVRMLIQFNGVMQPNAEDPNTIDYCEVSTYDFRGSFPSRLFNMMLSAMA